MYPNNALSALLCFCVKTIIKYAIGLSWVEIARVLISWNARAIRYLAYAYDDFIKANPILLRASKFWIRYVNLVVVDQRSSTVLMFRDC